MVVIQVVILLTTVSLLFAGLSIMEIILPAVLLSASMFVILDQTTIKKGG